MTGCICRAGIGARLAPHIFAQKYEDERRRAHDTDMERIMSTGMGPHNPGNAEQQVILVTMRSRAISKLIGWLSSADARPVFRQPHQLTSLLVGDSRQRVELPRTLGRRSAQTSNGGGGTRRT